LELNNERKIEALLNQSSREWNEDTDEYPERHVELDKFAELIIQECIELFADAGDEVEIGHGRALRRMIKEHFGVK